MIKNYIFEIIDKAMEAKDRYVSIYFTKDGDVSVCVYPLEEDEEELEKELSHE